MALKDDDVDLKTNKIHITKALYQRLPQIPKTEQSIRSVDMGPTVRRLIEAKLATQQRGYLFTPDPQVPLGNGTWIKRQWRKAQERAGVGPIRWHDLRHQFVSLLIHAGKHPKYIAQQAGHASAGFTMDRYGHLFETVTPQPVEWIDDFLGGRLEAKESTKGQGKTGQDSNRTTSQAK